MTEQTHVKTAVFGAAVIGLCCAAPLLVIALGAAGLSALTVHLGYVLVAAIALGAGVIAFGLYVRRQRQAARCAADAARESTKGR
jgi:mercuric ion transport protein